mgnify:CR=1 FL=1
MADKNCTTKPCVKCGLTDRYENGKCRPCAIARVKKWNADNPDRVKNRCIAWRKANPDRKLELDAAWRLANPEKVKASRAAWNEKNKDKIKSSASKWGMLNRDKKRAALAAWRKANPEASRLQFHNRQSRKRATGGVLSKGIADKLFKLQKGKCACCGLPLGNNYHIDHIMPVALGGANEDWNIQLLRQRCNNQKCAKHPVDFMQERGFLL